jgi:pSer/pThr/pTyr-binding forkhead associated (FHA) protein
MDAQLRWRLLRGSRSIALKEGSVTMGRGFDSHIVIDSVGASRLHARLHVTVDLLTIEDAGSTNGVYVNGERIRFSADLVDGDRILIGTVEYVVADSQGPSIEISSSSGPAEPDPSVAARPTPVIEDPSEWRSAPPMEVEEVGTTQKCDAISTLGRLADRMLVMGRADAAIRILGGHLRTVLDAIRTHERLDDETLRGATLYAMKLAAATNDGRWIDYVVDLHLTLGRLLDPEIARQIQVRVSQGVCVDPKLFAQYKIVVHQLMESGDEFDRMIGEMILAIP